MDINTEKVFLVNSVELEQDNLHTAASLQPNFATPEAAVHHEAPRSSTMCVPQPMDAPSRTQTCRLCATVTELVVPIFEGEGLQNGLADKIHQHLPIQVCETDVLPVVLCFQCTSTLLAWHELVLCCVQADTAMREHLNQPQQQQPAVDTSQREIKDEKLHRPPRLIKSALTEYIHSLNLDDQVTVVCQKCTNNPIFTPCGFMDHLTYTHDLAKSVKADIVAFLRNNVTFEEALASGGESDADSDSLELVDKSETIRQRAEKISDEPTVHLIEESELKNTDAATASQTDCLPTLLCPYCDSAFSSPTRLVHHLGAHIDISMEEGVQCCDVIYTTHREYVTHLQASHVSRMSYGTDTMCKSCGYQADTSQELQEHIIQWHSDRPTKREKLKESVLNQKFLPAVCPECDQVFSNKYNMLIHLKMHVTQKTFKCARCDNEYSTKGNLAQHVRLAHEGKLPHACRACGERFPTRGARDVHSRIHTGEKPFHCEICDKYFRAKNTLLRHRDIHLGIRKHECPTCNKKFQKWSHLSAHFRVHRKKRHLDWNESSHHTLDSHEAFEDWAPPAAHSDSDDSEDKPLASLVTERQNNFLKFYEALKNFRDHIANEHVSEKLEEESSDDEESPNETEPVNGELNIDAYDDLSARNQRRSRLDAETRAVVTAAREKGPDGRTVYRCHECGKMLSTQHTLLFHRRIHSGERPCVCHVCGAQFRTPHGLQRHLAETHERRRRATCRLCKRTFANAQNLKHHARTHTGERPYECEHCGKRFAQSGTLHAHRATHAAARPHACEQCGAAFRLRGGLARHALRHSGARPHACGACPRAFRTRHEAAAHRLAHADARPHACALCPAAFRLRRALRHHQRRLHADTLPPPPATLQHTGDDDAPVY